MIVTRCLFSFRSPNFRSILPGTAATLGLGSFPPDYAPVDAPIEAPSSRRNTHSRTLRHSVHGGKMVINMELQEAKDHVLSLMTDKGRIVADLKALKEILDSNHVGMEEPLVDSEGYPRSDIDVHRVRQARHKILCLTNDHKALMMKIEEGLHKVHALAGQQTECVSVDASESKSYGRSEPFLKVNLVSPGSPAEAAGIQAEDLVLEFGSADYQNFKSLKDIGTLVQNSRYKTIHVKIKRGSAILSLSLIPRPWVGNGLLGCNVIPVESVER